MYITPELIDLGCDDWPSESHRKVAQALGLCNKNVTSRDKLEDLCKAVNTIPSDKIELVTLQGCIEDYHVPYLE